MLVIPAVDIKEGKCVRLTQGDPKKSKVYFNDPLEAARSFQEDGAELLHLIDLDAALGSGQNMQVIERILTGVSMEVQVGGGVRTLEKAEKLLNLGVTRLIFGTSAVLNPVLIKETIRSYGSARVAVAIDEERGKAAFHGWKDRSEMDYLDLSRRLEALGVSTIVFTSVSVDGTLRGPQVEKIVRLVETVVIPVIASGGIASLDDLVTLAGIGVEGAIIGTALYEKKFTLRQAMEVLKNV